MRAAEKHHVSYVAIWVWLVVLLAVGLTFVALPVTKVTAIALIFSAAVVKAALVVRHYMHLRAQPVMVYVIMSVPVVLAIAMVLALIPDIAMRP
ncbi:MAG: cytochrome C oxidase subunit IV family protein [Deltaproteobacteria bacterium]|nr:cytochrome C oxidase subunit IV family protein [Deltaproteobacteria bacterium]